MSLGHLLFLAEVPLSHSGTKRPQKQGWKQLLALSYHPDSGQGQSRQAIPDRQMVAQLGFESFMRWFSGQPFPIFHLLTLRKSFPTSTLTDKVQFVWEERRKKPLVLSSGTQSKEGSPCPCCPIPHRQRSGPVRET